MGVSSWARCWHLPRQASGFRVQGPRFRVQGSGCWVENAGFRVQGSGCRVQGAGFIFQGAPRTLASIGMQRRRSTTRNRSCGNFVTCFFFAFVTSPRRSLSLELNDARVYEPQIRARLAGISSPAPRRERGLVFKAHRWLYHSTRGSRVIKKMNQT